MWTEETKARLADDADWWDRLDDGTKADLRAALAEIGRLSAERDRLADRLASEGASAAAEIERLKREQDAMVEEGVAPLIEALRERAEAAEADRDEWRETARSEMAGRRAAEAEIDRLREALTFYSDTRRYQGANQPYRDGDDPFTPTGSPFLIDVMRDGGTIARAALRGGGE